MFKSHRKKCNLQTCFYSNRFLGVNLLKYQFIKSHLLQSTAFGSIDCVNFKINYLPPHWAEPIYVNICMFQYTHLFQCWLNTLLSIFEIMSGKTKLLILTVVIRNFKLVATIFFGQLIFRLKTRTRYFEHFHRSKVQTLHNVHSNETDSFIKLLCFTRKNVGP